MKIRSGLFIACTLVFISQLAWCQEIATLFRSDGYRSSGGYGAVGSKLTRLGKNFAHLTNVYGGWYVNHKFTLGLSVAALTSDVIVPVEYRVNPQSLMSYQYAQIGLFTEYVIASNKAVHFNVQLFAGPGFSSQHKRFEYDVDDLFEKNRFTVIEPGANAEFNLLKWMRLTTGVSYRSAFGSSSGGLSIKDFNAASVNVGLKFGKF